MKLSSNRVKTFYTLTFLSIFTPEKNNLSLKTKVQNLMSLTENSTKKNKFLPSNITFMPSKYLHNESFFFFIKLLKGLCQNTCKFPNWDCFQIYSKLFLFKFPRRSDASVPSLEISPYKTISLELVVPAFSTGGFLV